ncbi:membrane magnesium transporter-domain-containing protein [Catenaria anguillulae PL171]|uniref:Membrane magnesium transporter-domain-containing protein n=1 Tax=Catenaria anguillulae PL171 TaxID=765915 RepID=A0A1Y2HDX1_9FUNG|nr:membrane magnesium transporter-domain-containing protein [Catenaria anguillulae PL171]
MTSMSTPQPNYFGRLVILLSLALLAHAGYSAFEHIAYLKSTDRVQDGLTLDIVLEALVATALCLVGLVLVADPLMEIALESELSKQSRDVFDARPSYRSLGHRGRHFGQVLAQAVNQ